MAGSKGAFPEMEDTHNQFASSKRTNERTGEKQWHVQQQFPRSRRKKDTFIYTFIPTETEEP